MRTIKIIAAVFVAIVLASFLMVRIASASVGKVALSDKKPVAEYALPKAKDRCKAHYVKRTIKVNKTERVKVHGKWKLREVTVRSVGCVYVAPKTSVPVPTPTPTPPAPVTTNLAVHLDPSFVQSASNPLSVVYTASATASNQVGDGPTQQLTSLPTGVLDFYSDGNLACSTNVGGSVTTNDCPVTYTSLGAHTVITEYISGTNSASETDMEEISGQTSTTIVTLTGDPGATPTPTTSTLNAVVSSPLGTDTTPALGTITFHVNNVTLTTTQASQSSCTLAWSPGPTFTQGNAAYYATATSPNCTMTGGTLQNISDLIYSASFQGVLGLTSSASAQTSVTDWPQVPAPITNYVTGDPYDVAIGATTISGCTVAGLQSIQFCLNAPSLSFVDANTSKTEGSGGSYLWMTTALADMNGIPFTPGTGEDCGTFESSSDQCPLGDDNQYGHVPNPLMVTFVVTPPNGDTIQGASIVTWNGAQETTTVATHALVGSESIQDLSS